MAVRKRMDGSRRWQIPLMHAVVPFALANHVAYETCRENKLFLLGIGLQGANMYGQ